jgi:hypothetical protein
VLVYRYVSALKGGRRANDAQFNTSNRRK